MCLRNLGPEKVALGNRPGPSQSVEDARPQMCRSGQQSGKEGQDLGEEARYLGHKNLRRLCLSGANPTLTDPESQGFLKFLCPRCLDCLTQVLGLQENQPLADLGVRTRRERETGGGGESTSRRTSDSGRELIKMLQGTPNCGVFF